MNFTTIIVDGLFTVFSVIFSIVLYPVDLLLNLINMPDLIDYITPILEMIGNVPDFLCYILGVNPILWNLMITVAIISITLMPLIWIIKRVIKLVQNLIGAIV